MERGRGHDGCVEKASTFRAFLGFNPDSPTVVEIKCRQNALKTWLEKHHELPGCRWVRPAQFHLTLAFLGAFPRHQVNPLAEALAGILKTHPVPSLEFSELGCFPAMRRPRVLWLGVVMTEALRRLQEEISVVLREQFGFQDERGFHPHLTLARLKSPRRPESAVDWQNRLAEFSRSCQWPSFHWQPDGLHLMSSQLSSSAGAEYHTVEVIPPRQGPRCPPPRQTDFSDRIVSGSDR